MSSREFPRWHPGQHIDYWTWDRLTPENRKHQVRLTMHFVHRTGGDLQVAFFVVDGKLIRRTIRRAEDPRRWSDDRDEALGAIDVRQSLKDALRPFSFEHNTHYSAARYAVKVARRALMRKGWEDCVTDTIRRWAWLQFAEMMRGEYCVDNYRVARLTSPSQMRRFKKQRAHGCCGSSEDVRVGPDGARYLLGCNYGH